METTTIITGEILASIEKLDPLLHHVLLKIKSEVANESV